MDKNNNIKSTYFKKSKRKKILVYIVDNKYCYFDKKDSKWKAA